MILNNLFGFTGISVFARYLVTPILILWCLYMVLKGLISRRRPPRRLAARRRAARSGSRVAAVIGFSMWGNEPDFWRYGRPRFSWPLPDLRLRARLLPALHDGRLDDGAARRHGDQSAIFRYTVHYSLFGLFFLAFIIATISQFAINDGNYYESVNAGQNLIGGWRAGGASTPACSIAGGGVIAG